MNDSHRTPSEILQIAYIQLLKQGWTQGNFFTAGGQCCLVGALQIGAYGKPLATPDSDQELAKSWAYRHLEEAIEPGAEHKVDLEAWNDDPERSVKDVLAALVRAHTMAKEKEQ